MMRSGLSVRPETNRVKLQVGVLVALSTLGPLIDIPCGRDPRSEAFMYLRPFGSPMARFPEAERRKLHKMICMQCYARNAPRATRCRKCGSTELRPKAKEARKE